MTVLSAELTPFDTSRPASAGMLRRFLKRLIESRQRAAEIEVARYIQARGGRLTDEVERAISPTLV